MNLLYFTVFGIGIFLAILIGGRKYRYTALYALAIGGAVNANFFTSISYPIDIFGITFGIDSVIYTLFIFCIILMFFHKGKKDAYLLGISSLIAIMISALFDLVSKLLSKGFYTGVFSTMTDFTISCVVSLIVIVIILESLDKIYKKYKNQYVLTTISLIVALFVNTPLFYILAALVNNEIENTFPYVLGSTIGKIMASVFALFALFLLNTINKNSKEKNNNE